MTRAAGVPGADSSRRLYLGPWRVDVVTRATVRSPLAGATVARQVGRGLEASGAPEPGSVTVVLTDDEELAELNAAHMGRDGATDVLSFPMLPPEAFRRDPAGGPARRKPWAPVGGRPRTHIGDIAISVERATEQALDGRGGHEGRTRWSPSDELRLLVTHGALHLCGWDHAEPDEERTMRGLENRLLEG